MDQPKFLVDTMLGRLSQWLRLIGYDAAFVQDHQRRQILERSFLEKRCILTRETKLEKAACYQVLILRQQHYWEQIPFVWKTLKLPDIKTENLFSRCLSCNTAVEIVSKMAIKRTQVPPKVYEYQQNFSRCPKCQKIFWRGGHFSNTVKKLNAMGFALPETT